MYEFVYTISCILHFLGLYYAVRTVLEGETLFCNSSPLNIFKSSIEQKFWFVVIGGFGNVCFLLVKPLYIFFYNGHTTGWQEPIWMAGHLSIGLATCFWHKITLQNIMEVMGNERTSR